MAKNNAEIVKAARVDTPLTIQDDSLFDTNLCNHVQWLAERFAGSDITPANFRGKPENCFIVIHQARRLQVDPLMMMQKTYVVHGKMGMEAQMAIALVNARGPFKDGIEWEFTGEGMERSCTAFAFRKGSKNKCEATVSMKMAQAEGWMKDSGSKWHTLPDLMMRYRSATFLARLYCPEVLLGMNSAQELRDMEAAAPVKPLVAGEMVFGRKPQLEADKAPEPASEPVDVTPVQDEAPESPPVPPAAAVDAPESDEEPKEGFSPVIGLYVQNGPRGQVVRITQVDPPEFMKPDGTLHGRSLWPPKTQAWVAKGDNFFTDGNGEMHPKTFAEQVTREAIAAAPSEPEPDPAPAADGPDPTLPMPVNAPTTAPVDPEPDPDEDWTM